MAIDPPGSTAVPGERRFDPVGLTRTFLDSVRLWPSGVVSAVGSLTIAAGLVVQAAPGMDLTTAEYIATLVVGGVLTLAGPVTAGMQVRSAGRSAGTYVAELERLEEARRRARESDGAGGRSGDPDPRAGSLL